MGFVQAFNEVNLTSYFSETYSTPSKTILQTMEQFQKKIHLAHNQSIVDKTRTQLTKGREAYLQRTKVVEA